MYDNQFIHAHGKVKKEDLDRIEQKFHVKIPAEVQKHYLTYNGSYLAKTVFTDKNSEEYFVDWLIPFANEDGGNLFCFSVRESDFGAVYYYNHEFEYGEDSEEHVTDLSGKIPHSIYQFSD